MVSEKYRHSVTKVHCVRVHEPAFKRNYSMEVNQMILDSGVKSVHWRSVKCICTADERFWSELSVLSDIGQLHSMTCSINTLFSPPNVVMSPLSITPFYIIP